MCPGGTSGCLGNVTTGHRELQLWGRKKEHLIYMFVSLQAAILQLDPSTHTCDPYSPVHLQPTAYTPMPSVLQPAHLHL